MQKTNCEICAYYCFDDDFGDYVCDASMDEDEYMKMISGAQKGCPYYRPYDEYKIVRKQN